MPARRHACDWFSPRWPCALAWLACMLLGSVVQAADARLELLTLSGSGHVVDVTGLSDERLAAFDRLSPDEKKSVLEVFVQGDVVDPPPVVGTTSVVGRRLRFTPRYPLEPGLSYRARFQPARLAGDRSDAAELTEVFSLARPASEPTTVVEHIYPSSDELPENQLKFYIHFSAPMSRGEAYRHVHLLDELGKPVEAPFLELGEELWDGDQQRFTLLCDPGRVKRGLKPREELGPVLEDGRSYTLVVDNDWRDATRTPLNAGARKSFTVGPPDTTPIDPQRWKLVPPTAGTIDPMLVRFGEPLDHSLLERMLWIVDAEGKKASGTIHTGDDEACWQFTPESPWQAGKYELVAQTTLEDLAGNSIGRPFEVDEFNEVDRQIEAETVSIPFVIEADR